MVCDGQRDFLRIMKSKEEALSNGIALSYGVLLCITSLRGGGQDWVKYVIYTLPFIALLLSGAYSGATFVIQKRALYAAVIIVLVYFMSIMYSGRVEFGGRFAYFVLATPLTFLLVRRMTHGSIEVILVFLALATGIRYVASPSINSEMFLDFGNLLSGNFSGAESGLAFPAGACLIYFTTRRDWKWALLSVAVIAVNGKRGALLAVFAALIAFYNLGRVGKRPKSTAPVILSLLVFTAGVILSFEIGNIFEWLHVEFFPEVSVNAWTQGRFVNDAHLINSIMDGNWTTMVFGYGPGYSEEFMQGISELTNPHNDYFFMILDTGILGLFGGTIAWVVLNGGSRLTFAFAVMTAILYLIDNTYVYYYHTFVVTAIMFATRSEDAVKPEAVQVEELRVVQ